VHTILVMNKKVEQALSSAVGSFCQHVELNAPLLAGQVLNVFKGGEPFIEKVALLDRAFNDLPLADPLREIFFDLLLVNFFTGDVKKLEEDYLDSPEWEAIEEQTIDRGTELLNLLLYLNECEDEGISPELGDYLREFLLVDDDEFQDEHRIYEDVIANQILTESSYTEIAAVATTIPDDSEIKELFYPVMSFFHEQDPSRQQLESYISNSEDPGFDHAVYSILITYKP
jgi:hypothetical protein